MSLMNDVGRNVVCVLCSTTAVYCFDELHRLVDPSSASRVLFCATCGATLQRSCFPSSKTKPKPPTSDEEQLALDAFVGQILVRHNDLIQKFLVITERKVAVLDEYGDENWDALVEEIDRCVAKISKRGQPFFRADKFRFEGRKFRHLPPLFADRCALRLSHCLSKKFRDYHQTRAAVSAIGQDFSNLTGIDFEVYVANVLKEAGFEEVAGTSATGDQGADLIARRNGKTIAFQVKGYAGSVGNEAVQEVVAALKFYKADEAWVVTNSNFTPSARSLAHANNVRLVDRNDLRDFKKWVEKIDLSL